MTTTKKKVIHQGFKSSTVNEAEKLAMEFLDKLDDLNDLIKKIGGNPYIISKGLNVTIDSTSKKVGKNIQINFNATIKLPLDVFDNEK